MTLITALEIEANYPQDILIEGVQDKKTGKWVSIMHLLKGSDIHKTMLSFDISENFAGFDTMEDAIEKMEEIAQVAINYVKGAYKGNE